MTAALRRVRRWFRDDAPTGLLVALWLTAVAVTLWGVVGIVNGAIR